MVIYSYEMCIRDSYSSDEEHEIIHVKLDASLLDYVVDDDSGKVLEGSKTDYVYRSYNLEFIRKKGIKTKEQEGTAVTKMCIRDRSWTVI